jgi:hypothetical protein
MRMGASVSQDLALSRVPVGGLMVRFWLRGSGMAVVSSGSGWIPGPVYLIPRLAPARMINGG